MTDDVIPPPHSFTVEESCRPVLYLADGTPLKRQIGFHMSQTSGTFPQLKDNTLRKPKPKGGKKGC